MESELRNICAAAGDCSSEPMVVCSNEGSRLNVAAAFADEFGLSGGTWAPFVLAYGAMAFPLVDCKGIVSEAGEKWP